MEELRQQGIKALLKCCRRVLESILADHDLERHYAVPLSLIQLADVDPMLAEAVMQEPKAALALLDSCLRPAQDLLLPQLQSQQPARLTLSSQAANAPGASAVDSASGNAPGAGVQAMTAACVAKPGGKGGGVTGNNSHAPSHSSLAVPPPPNSQTANPICQLQLPGFAMCVKENVHLRLHSLPHTLDPRSNPAANPSIQNLGARHIGRLVAVAGTVVSTGPVRVFEPHQVYACCSCKGRFLFKCNMEEGGAAELPETCPSVGDDCPGSSFKRVEGLQLFTEHQEIKVQERMQCLALGAMPASTTVLLQDEMASTCQPGDDVTITGLVMRKWHSMKLAARCDLQLTVRASHCAVNTAKVAAPSEIAPETEALFQAFWAAHAGSPLMGRSKVLSGMCPQVHGMFIVKLAAMLMLISGVERDDSAGRHVRGNVHMLLIGDPGTGKSQIMRFASKLSPRAVVTTGRGSTAAGLTAAAIKENGEWTLKAGALVLADGGLCCIDEFDGIREMDRATLHEAMEQQTVNIAKAGLMTTLSTRTSILAATNPKRGVPFGDRSTSIEHLTNLSGPLLSRFDIVLLLVDGRDPEWDSLMAEHVLDNHMAGCSASTNPIMHPLSVAPTAASSAPSTPQPLAITTTTMVPAATSWTLDMLRKYLQWVRSRFRPVMTPEAEVVILNYYRRLRQDEGSCPARSTVRMLESLVRIAQAHARLLARHEVTTADAVTAVLLTEASTHALGLGASCAGAGILGGSSVLTSQFPQDPDSEFSRQQQAVLTALGLGAPALMPPPPRWAAEWAGSDGAVGNSCADRDNGGAARHTTGQWEHPNYCGSAGAGRGGSESVDIRVRGRSGGGGPGDACARAHAQGAGGRQTGSGGILGIEAGGGGGHGQHAVDGCRAGAGGGAWSEWGMGSDHQSKSIWGAAVGEQQTTTRGFADGGSWDGGNDLLLSGSDASCASRGGAGLRSEVEQSRLSYDAAQVADVRLEPPYGLLSDGGRKPRSLGVVGAGINESGKRLRPPQQDQYWEHEVELTDEDEDSRV